MPARKKSVVTDVEQEVKKVLTEAEVRAEEFAKNLEGKTVQELRILHDEALVDESEAKKFLVLLRARANNMASTVGIEVEEEIIRSKQEWARAVEWLRAIEKKLEGEFKDISGIHKF